MYTSMLTFMIYLDSPLDGDFEGGSTNFLRLSDKHILKEVIPQTGMALVFQQKDDKAHHEGALLKKGEKHILRTDVMYSRSKRK